jgi:predicted PurR-regulated permease PerM
MKNSKTKNILFFSLLGLITVLFLYLLKPFFYPIFWAAVIASLFRPFYNWLEEKIRRPSLSASVVLLAVLLIIILPIFLIGALLVNESIAIYTSLSEDHSPVKEFLKDVPERVRQNPYVRSLNIDEGLLAEKLSDMAKDITNFIFTSLKGFTQNTVVFVTMFLIMLYTLFFFIRDGETFLRKTVHLFPLGERRERMLYEKFTSATRATIKGTLVVAFIQGSLAGLLFSLVGIEGALIWWVLMVFLAVIPGVGCSIVWLPAGIVMLLTGHTWEGITILLTGTLVISMVDNALRPILVGRDIQMHPLFILFSTLGGIALFGVSGIVIGPIITALLLSLWQMYDQQYIDRDLL